MQLEISVLLAVCRSLVSWYLKLLLTVIILNIIFSWVRSPTVRYYGCYITYVITTSVVSIAYMPLLLLRLHDPANIQFATQPISVLTGLMGIKWELRGAKYLDKEEAAVIVINHQSMFDVMGLLSFGSSLQKAWTVARKEVFYYWPFGLLLWLSGAILIDRKNGRKSSIKLMNSIEKVKKQKAKLVMFPEGTRNRQGNSLLPFKKGAFRMAIEGQIPIFPIVFSPYYFINSEKKLFYRGKIIMSCLAPISTEGKTMADLDILMEKTRAIMDEEFQKLKIEIACKNEEIAIENGHATKVL